MHHPNRVPEMRRIIPEQLNEADQKNGLGTERKAAGRLAASEAPPTAHAMQTAVRTGAGAGKSK
jgi:hypothetical protein